MSLIFPDNEHAWRRAVENFMKQHHTDIQRLWKRTPETPQPGGGDCCGLIGMPGGGDGDDGVGSEPEGTFPGSYEGSHLSGGSGLTHGTTNTTGTNTGGTTTGGTTTGGTTTGGTTTGGTNTGGTNTGGTNTGGTNTGGTNTGGTNTGGTNTGGTNTGGTNTGGTPATGGTGITACCSGASIPATLTATLNGVAGCGCLAGATTTLAWNGTGWFGSFTPGSCGHVYELTLTCFSGTTYTLVIHYPDACGGDLTNNATATCSPFSLIMPTYIAGTSCGCTGGGHGAQFSVTITE